MACSILYPSAACFFHSASCLSLIFASALFHSIFLISKTWCFNPGSWLPYPSLNRIMLPPPRCGTCCPLGLGHSTPSHCHNLLLAWHPHHLSPCLTPPVSLPCLRFFILLHIWLIYGMFAVCLPQPEYQAYTCFVHCHRLQFLEQCWAHNRCSVSI